MTDREKAFVMNGLRNHIRTIAGAGSTHWPTPMRSSCTSRSG